jgi:hypothetical protein
MFTLSLEKSHATQPAVIIEGGELDGHIVYVKYLDRKCCTSHSLECGNTTGKCCKKCAFHPDIIEIPRADGDLLPLFSKYRGDAKIKMMQKIKKAIALNRLPIDDDEVELYNAIKKRCEQVSDLKINEGTIELYPNTKMNIDKTYQRDIIYASGSGGSGKTTFVGKYLKNYKKAFPHNDIYVFSRHEVDPEIDKLKPIKVPINDNLINMELELKQMENSCVVFDDCGAIPEKKFNDFLFKLQCDLLENSRHHNINMCVTSHTPSNYTKTRLLLAEMTHFVLFNTGSRKQINYVLETYLGFTKRQINEMYRLPTRWWCISKLCPQWVAYEKGMYLL